MWKVLFAALVMTSLTACSGHQPIADSACIAYRPIYLPTGAILALREFRQVREEIAAHNTTYEGMCSG